MNKLDFLSEIDRVLAFYHRPDEKKEPGDCKDYNIQLDEIYKKVSWIEAIKFKLVVDALMDVRPRYRKDLDHRRVLAVYGDLAEKNGWKRATDRNCPDCKGLRFVDVWLKDKKGVEFKAVKGCSNCNPRVAGVHAEFTEIERPDAEVPRIDLEKLRRIPPSFASFLLGVAQRTEPSPKEEIAVALVEAMGQPDAGRRPGSQPNVATFAEPIKNPTKHRNQMVRALAEAPPVQVVDAGTAEEEPAKMEPPPAPAEQPSPATATKITVDETEEPMVLF